VLQWVSAEAAEDAEAGVDSRPVLGANAFVPIAAREHPINAECHVLISSVPIAARA
jgi:hypothetical protein